MPPRTIEERIKKEEAAWISRDSSHLTYPVLRSPSPPSPPDIWSIGIKEEHDHRNSVCGTEESERRTQPARKKTEDKKKESSELNFPISSSSHLFYVCEIKAGKLAGIATIPWEQTSLSATSHFSDRRKRRKEAATWILRVSSSSHLSCSTLTTPFTTPPDTHSTGNTVKDSDTETQFVRQKNRKEKLNLREERKEAKKEESSQLNLPRLLSISGNFHKLWQELSPITKKETKSRETIIVKQRQYQWNSSSYKQAPR